MSLIEQLKAYYDARGIGIADCPDFKCPHMESCKGDSLKFTTAKASYVGKEYENPASSFPRLLFLSLDPYKSREMADRTFERVREIEEGRSAENLKKNPHWLQTHQLAQKLLNVLHPDYFASPLATQAYFAHVNSAKCCQNLNGMSRGTLFDNCREIIPGEIQILRPEIIVSQGGKAKAAISLMGGIIQVSEKNQTKINFEWGTVPVGADLKALWIPTYHPTYFRYIKRDGLKFNMYWDEYAELIRKYFVEKSPLP